MTLGQFAVAVGAAPRWVLNALSRLGVRRSYSEPLARRLALARLLNENARMPLTLAFAVAGRVLAEADPGGTWKMESPDGSVTVSVDMPRFFTTYGAALARANTHYGERLRGRRPTRRGTAMKRASAFGIDTTLIHSSLDRSVEQRLDMLDDNVQFLRAIRLAMP